MEQNEKVTLQRLKKEMEAMRAEYERKLAAFSDGAQKLPEQPAVSAPRRILAAEEAWLNEYVEIKLFKDNDKYKDDVYVSINGKNCVIRRGEWTRIRRKFALLLDQSEVQDLRTAELIAGESERFAGASRRVGL